MNQLAAEDRRKTGRGDTLGPDKIELGRPSLEIAAEIEARTGWIEAMIEPPAGTDWSDVADFDSSQPSLRRYIAESTVFWMREHGI
jgi:hypothetical protein